MELSCFASMGEASERVAWCLCFDREIVFSLHLVGFWLLLRFHQSEIYDLIWACVNFSFEVLFLCRKTTSRQINPTIIANDLYIDNISLILQMLIHHVNILGNWLSYVEFYLIIGEHNTNELLYRHWYSFSIIWIKNHVSREQNRIYEMLSNLQRHEKYDGMTQDDSNWKVLRCILDKLSYAITTLTTHTKGTPWLSNYMKKYRINYLGKNHTQISSIKVVFSIILVCKINVEDMLKLVYAVCDVFSLNTRPHIMLLFLEQNFTSFHKELVIFSWIKQ